MDYLAGNVQLVIAIFGINPFIEDKEIYNFHYINSSVGLEGIVITKK